MGRAIPIFGADLCDCNKSPAGKKKGKEPGFVYTYQVHEFRQNLVQKHRDLNSNLHKHFWTGLGFIEDWFYVMGTPKKGV